MADDAHPRWQWPRRVGRGVAESWGRQDDGGWHYRWSATGSGRSWSGTDVLDGLVEAIEMHVAETWRSRQDPLVIGCCPWLTDEAVARALATLPCCLVVAKPGRSSAEVVRRLMTEGEAVHKGTLSPLDMLALPTEDGSTPLGVAP